MTKAIVVVKTTIWRLPKRATVSPHDQGFVDPMRSESIASAGIVSPRPTIRRSAAVTLIRRFTASV